MDRVGFRLLRSLLALIVSVVPASSVSGATYYVATNGSDANWGTNVNAPLQTLHQVSTRLAPGDTCLIRGGVYHETLTVAASGAPGAPITFSACSNELVTIDGADVVGGWAAATNSLYWTAVGWDLGAGRNQLFVDAMMVPQARDPDFGTGDVLHPALVPVQVNSRSPTQISSTAWVGKPDNWCAGAWFVGGVGGSWSWQSARVLASTNSVITVDPATQTTSWWFTGSGNGFLMGTRGLLDADNEWELVSGLPTNVLFLRLPGGADPSTHRVEMKRRVWCVDLNSRNWIVVSNLNFWGGAVRLLGNNNVLASCRGQYLSHFTLIQQGFLEDGGDDSGRGVDVDGISNIVSGCAVSNTAGSGVYTSGSSNTIMRNLISNTDYSGTYACCLALHGNGDLVAFNTAFNSGRDVLRPSGTGQSILFNDLSSPGLLCKDLGVIYAFGIRARSSNGVPTRIAFNWIHDNDYAVPSPLVYLDNFDADFVVDHNVIWNTVRDSGIRINAPALGHRIYNNTLFNCANVGLNTYDAWGTGNPDPTFWTNDVYQYSASNNLFLANAPATQLVDWSGGNFSLIPGSPVIDAGVPIPGFTDGFFGLAPDLGACESGSLPWRPGAMSRPTLAIRDAGGGNILLIASPDAAFYHLYSNTNLGVNALWQALSITPVLSNYQWSTVVSSLPTTAMEFRLQSP